MGCVLRKWRKNICVSKSNKSWSFCIFFGKTHLPHIHTKKHKMQMYSRRKTSSSSGYPQNDIFNSQELFCTLGSPPPSAHFRLFLRFMGESQVRTEERRNLCYCVSSLPPLGWSRKRNSARRQHSFSFFQSCQNVFLKLLFFYGSTIIV